MNPIDRTMLQSHLSELEGMLTDLEQNPLAHPKTIKFIADAMKSIEKDLKRQD